MLEARSLLPRNRTALIDALFEASYRMDELGLGVDALRGFKFTPNDSVVPHLIVEYGLEEIEEFFPVRRDVLKEGIKWRRLVGTPAAVHMALRWIGYIASIEEEWVGRRKWNTFQFRFPSLPGADRPDLPWIEKIADISTPLRSRLRRGVHQYDVGPAMIDYTRLDCAMIERESGVAITPAGTIWSFGRTQQVDYTLTKAEGEALGNWIEPSEGQVSLRWQDMNYPWSSATFPWEAQSSAQRASLMASWFLGKTLYVCLRNAQGEAIGYRRCRAVHAVRQRGSGYYSFGAGRYEKIVGGQILYVEAMTDFGDSIGAEARKVSLVSDAILAEGVKPGKLWLQPGDLSGGVEFASSNVSFPTRQTVREQIKFLVRF